jgi:hypothetical protein
MIRKIITTYSFKRTETKITRSVHPERAVLNAIYHMQRNDYSASLAQVSCDETGKLYAIILRRMDGRIIIHYHDSSIFVETDKYGHTIKSRSPSLAKRKKEDATNAFLKSQLSATPTNVRH